MNRRCNRRLNQEHHRRHGTTRFFFFYALSANRPRVQLKVELELGGGNAAERLSPWSEKSSVQ
jgi:hypothetical protein